jgi:hypothetical protein
MQRAHRSIRLDDDALGFPFAAEIGDDPARIWFMAFETDGFSFLGRLVTSRGGSLIHESIPVERMRQKRADFQFGGTQS